MNIVNKIFYLIIILSVASSACVEGKYVNLLWCLVLNVQRCIVKTTSCMLVFEMVHYYCKLDSFHYQRLKLHCMNFVTCYQISIYIAEPLGVLFTL